MINPADDYTLSTELPRLKRKLLLLLRLKEILEHMENKVLEQIERCYVSARESGYSHRDISEKEGTAVIYPENGLVILDITKKLDGL